MTDSLGCIDILDIFIDQPQLITSTQNEIACDNYNWLEIHTIQLEHMLE